MTGPSSWLALLKPKRIRRRRGESPADTQARHFRELEARYRALGLSPKAATKAAMKGDAGCAKLASVKVLSSEAA